jgi:hypothetical protein
MITALVIVAFVLLVLVLSVALGDRVCAALAERKASEFLSEPFGHPATVRVHGAPFLTQALRGRYAKVEVLGGGLRIGEMAGATLSAFLHNVVLPPKELLGGRTRQLPVERVEGRIVLPYGEIARVSRIPGLSLVFSGGRLVASAAVPVPGLSQLARVSGVAELAVAEDGAVWLHVRHFSVAGISLTALLIKQLMPVLSVPIPLRTLPYRLRLDEIVATPTGLVITGSAHDVVFRPPTAAINDGLAGGPVAGD